MSFATLKQLLINWLQRYKTGNRIALQPLKTTIMSEYKTVHTKRELLAQSDSPSFLELVTLTINMSKNTSFAELRNSIETLSYFVDNNIRIEMAYRDYDCTGQQFTTSLRRINWFTWDTGDECLLIAIYKHWVSIDV